jgi:hypothetical protein
MSLRLSIMLMPYLVLYRLSKWRSLPQGKRSQLKQYFAWAVAMFSQVFIRHRAQDLGLVLSSALQPGHGFLSLPNARQRRQFIPHGAISIVGIVFGLVDLLGVMSRLPSQSTSIMLSRISTTLWTHGLHVVFARLFSLKCL